MKRYAAIVLGLIVSGALFAMALRNVELAEVVRAVSGVRPGWLPPMVGVILGDLFIRALRWRLLLSAAAGHAGVLRLFRLETIGLAVNNVGFLRVGEIVRGFLAAREMGVSPLTCLASIVIERVLDTAALALLFGTAAVLYPEAIPAGLGTLAYLATGTLLVSLVLISYADGSLHQGVLARRLGRFPRLLRLLRQIALGTEALRSWPTALAAGGLSLLLWVLDAGLYWSGGQAIALEPGLNYGRSMLVLSTAAASTFLPAMPGSFGAFEQAIKALLVVWGVEAAAALGFAGFVHLLNYLVVTGLGIAFLYRAGHSLASLKALGRQGPSA